MIKVQLNEQKLQEIYLHFTFFYKLFKIWFNPLFDTCFVLFQQVFVKVEFPVKSETKCLSEDTTVHT